MCDTMYYAGSMLSDSNDVLHPRWCLRWNPTNSADMTAHDYLTSLKAYLQADGGIGGAEGTMYVDTIFMDADDMEPMYETIQKRLFYFAANTREAGTAAEAPLTPKPIQGPVYVILGQAPYYLDEYGDTIHHQPFQRQAYGMNPTLPQTLPPKAGLRIYAHLLFPMYKKDKTKINSQTPGFDFNQHYKNKLRRVKGLKVDANMCKIKCLNSSSLLCGCVNQNEPYRSRCMAENTDTGVGSLQNKNVFADHCMLYRINENARRMSPLFSKIYFEDIKI